MKSVVLCFIANNLLRELLMNTQCVHNNSGCMGEAEFDRSISRSMHVWP